MVFNSLTFLVFLAAFFPLYFLTKGATRLWICFIASYIFYGWWDWRFIGLIMLSTVIDFFLGQRLHYTQEPQLRQRWMVVSVVLNLGILAFFKYFNFFIDSVASGLTTLGFHASIPALSIILPVGISFYTFQSMSYTIDIYRRELEPEPNFLRFATFVSFFPQLVAGPIVRASDFLPQFKEDRRFEWDNFWTGLGRVLWGFFKKVVVADSIATFVDQCFDMPEAFSAVHLLVGVVFYSFQIYCDFSGYTDIAIGLARILGYKFNENFKTPYFSQNFSEFWSRWHISLSTWLRDYLYIPLGGNRKGTWKTYRNLMLTMLLGGLWHGANWAFVFWGFLHGLYQVVQRFTSKPFGRLMRFLHLPSFAQVGINVLIVYSLTLLAWVYFRAGSMGARSFDIANQVLGTILAGQDFSPGSIIHKFVVAKGFLTIFIVLAVELSNFKINYIGVGLQNPSVRIVSYAALLLAIAALGTFSSNAFIYFQF
jgi:D-alanyl-lipoteichoic acid acyltransferase DltB (MBOAT superfamily)